MLAIKSSLRISSLSNNVDQKRTKQGVGESQSLTYDNLHTKSDGSNRCDRLVLVYAAMLGFNQARIRYQLRKHTLT